MFDTCVFDVCLEYVFEYDEAVVSQRTTRFTKRRGYFDTTDILNNAPLISPIRE